MKSKWTILGEPFYKGIYLYVKCRCTCGKVKDVHYVRHKKQPISKKCSRDCNGVLNANKNKAYKVWKAMVYRCTNPTCKSYHNYGGRGITVSTEWKKFENFLRDMRQPPKGMDLDRIDNNKGYSKENCRWATRTVNTRNKRTNTYVCVGDRLFSLVQACEILGLNYATVKKWSRQFLTPEEYILHLIKKGYSKCATLEG